MTTASTAEEAFEIKLEERLAQRRAAKVKSFDHEALLWLGLVPRWTLSLAEMCGFPAGNLTIADFLNEAAAAGICRSRQVSSIDRKGKRRRETEFWVPGAARREMIDQLLRDQWVDLGNKAAAIAEAVLPALADVRQVPQDLPCWASLAIQLKDGTPAAAQWLREKINRKVSSGDSGRALAWLRAGRDLAGLLGGEMEAAVLLANRRIELSYRISQDRRYLKSFLERREQISAFRDLINGADDHWALHYLGLGGIGKTMLLRHISSKLADEENIIVSRVDFDYINPDYPLRRPGQLLLGLAEELQPHFSHEQHEFVYRDFVAEVISLHEDIGQVPPASDPLINIRHDLFRSILGRFVSLVLLVTESASVAARRPVFILDTCEELNKLQTGTGFMPHLEATFQIFEWLRESMAQMRVVFSGRRLLARSGFEWRVDPAAVSAERPYLLPNRKYLKLHIIRGFDRQEANVFLKSFQNPDQAMTAAIKNAILRHSPDPGLPARTQFKDARRSGKPAKRYNPFNLNLFGDWFRDDPNFTAKTITGDNPDPYIEKRIINRIRSAGVRRLLPAVTLLRRASRDLLQSLYESDADDFEAAFQQLSDQEWIGHTSDDVTGETTLEIDPNICERMETVVRRMHSRQEINYWTFRLSTVLKKRIQDVTLTQISIDQLEAALRLLPPPEAAALWDVLDRAIPRQADWNWTLNVTRRLAFGEGSAAVRMDSPLHAAVLATHVAANIQLSRDYIAIEAWYQVEKSAAGHPLPEIGDWLRQRAVAGRIADSRIGRDKPAREDVERLLSLIDAYDEFFANRKTLDEFHRTVLTGACAAAIETLLDRSEYLLENLPASSGNTLQAWLASVMAHRYESFIHCLQARLAALQAQWAQVDSRLNDMIQTQSKKAAAPDWRDWHAPDHFQHRLLLELLRFYGPTAKDVSAVVQYSDDNIDSERQVSRCIAIVENQHLDPMLVFNQAFENFDYQPNRRPICAAHFEARPLFYQIALAHARTGMARSAVAMLDDYSEKAKNTAEDAVTVDLAREAKVFAIQRMRWDDQAARMISRYRSDRRPIPGIWLLGVLCGQLQQEELKKLAADRQTLLEMHSFWRASIPADPVDAAARLAVRKDREMGLNDEIDATLSSMQDGVYYSEAEFIYLHLLLDLEEAAQLKAGGDELPRLRHSDVVDDFIDRCVKSPRLYRQDDLLAVVMRQAALGGRDRSELIDFLAQKIGLRRAAEVAFEEGEALALRLPDPALSLFNWACRFYNLAKDPVGEVLSTTMLTLGTIRTKNQDETALLVRERLWPAYKRLGKPRLKLKHLPTWQELKKLSHAPPESEMLKKAGEWRGWLERIHCCQVWAAARDDDGQMADRYMNWLSVRYRSLPPDFPDDPVWGTIDSVGRSQREKSGQVEDEVLPRQPTPEESGPQTGSAAPGGLRITVPQPFQKARRDGEKRIMDLFIEAERPRALSASRLSKNNVDVAIIDVEPGLIYLRSADDTFQRSEGMTDYYRSEWYAPYEKLAADLSAQIRQGISAICNETVGREQAMRLRLDQTMAWFPWEAFLQAAVDPEIRYRTLMIRELLHARKIEADQIERNWSQGPIHIYFSRDWRRAAEYIFSPLTQTEVIVHHARAKMLNMLREPDMPMRILYLMGTPVATSDGLSFQLGADFAPVEQKISTRGGDDNVFYITSQQLPATSIGMVILQPEPRQQQRRSESDREQAAYLRAFAAEISGAGTPLVLALPALAPGQTENLFKSMVEIFAAQSLPGIRRIESMLRMIRTVMMESQNDLPPGDREENADDLCIFYQKP